MEFEINGQILISETVNAEGTNVSVRDSAKFEISHVRKSGTLLYYGCSFCKGSKNKVFNIEIKFQVLSNEKDSRVFGT